MLQPGRKYSQGSAYRYGFNGKENDNDVKGEANQQDYGMRIYDPRLGRFLSVDPITKSYPSNSPFSFAENDVMRSIDIDGLEKYFVNRTLDNKGNLLNVTIQSFTDNNGNLRDNKTYDNNKKLAKADVYIITRNVAGQQIGIMHTETNLSSEEQIVVNNFTTTTKVSKIIKDSKIANPGSYGINDNLSEGPVKGIDWKDGTENIASINLTPSVNLDFQVNSNKPVNTKESNKLAGIARILNIFPSATVRLIGNTGSNGPDSAPVGNTPNVLKYSQNVSLNGAPSTLGNLMRARATAAKQMLHNRYGISNTRMQVGTGSNQYNITNRKVDVKITGINL